jgi:peptidyl-prolyl cis-trans isomerase D
MQHHKKWLIVTIWIATIAFVGAGFVGWGAYSYGKKQDEIARVKDTSIKVKDVQEIYQQLFSALNKTLNGKLDEATAKKFGLEKEAFKEALKRAMLLQFAKDNGLYITDEDLAKYIVEIELFQKNGKFDRKTYEQVLKNIRQTPKEFEENMKKQLLIEKISNALNLKSTITLQDTIASLFLMQDDVFIQKLYPPEIKVTDDEIFKYWQKHKESYKSPLSYNIGYFYVPLQANVDDKEMMNYYEEHKINYTDKDGKILSFEKAKQKVKKDLMAKKTKKEAILTMKKLKNNQLQFKMANNLNIQNDILSIQNMDKLISNKFLKPTLTQKGWLIAKLFKTNQPKTLPFEKAKKFAKNELIKQKRIDTLTTMAKNKLNSFKGTHIGFIGKDDVLKLQDMSVDDATSFITSLFETNKTTSFVLLPEHNPKYVVLFKIKEQKLLDKDKYQKYKQMMKSYADKLKTDELNKNLLKKLKTIYQAHTKIYIKI